MMATRPQNAVLRFGDMEVRPAEYEVLVGGRRVGLTVREFQTFLCLVKRHDRVMTRHEIYDCVWGGKMAHRDRSVDVCVRKVRRKLDAVAPGVAFIHTHFGVGYRFAIEPVHRIDTSPSLGLHE